MLDFLLCMVMRTFSEEVSVNVLIIGLCGILELSVTPVAWKENKTHKDWLKEIGISLLPLKHLSHDN